MALPYVLPCLKIDLFTVFKFPNEKYLSKKKVNCIYSPKGICAVVNTP